MLREMPYRGRRYPRFIETLTTGVVGAARLAARKWRHPGFLFSAGDGAVRDQVEADTVEAALVHQPSFLLYGGGIGISLLMPTVGVAFYLVTALYLGIPGRTLHRLVRRK
jgi:hypothetical protein